MCELPEEDEQQEERNDIPEGMMMIIFTDGHTTRELLLPEEQAMWIIANEGVIMDAWCNYMRDNRDAALYWAFVEEDD